MFEGENIAAYVIHGNLWENYCIVPEDVAGYDVVQAIEETMHRLIDDGKEELIPEILGLTKNPECPMATAVDLGYYIPDVILSIRENTLTSSILFTA